MKLGVIGGSGLYDLDGLTDVRQLAVDTPFGAPSDELVTGTLDGTEMVFLPRHGRGHRILPHEINYRANIHALKSLGVGYIISVSAVGSMKEKIEPGHLVLPDQFIDRALSRVGTFFGNGIVAHVSMADPVCSAMSGRMEKAATHNDIRIHRGGTYVCINGPQFSTRAESLLYRSWGVSVIGMTNMPEARLAREAEICYATLALSTDYDCWHTSEEDANVESIMAVMMKNVESAKRVITDVAKSFEPADCACHHALENTIVTRPDQIAPELRETLELLVGKYFQGTI